MGGRKEEFYEGAKQLRIIASDMVYLPCIQRYVSRMICFTQFINETMGSYVMKTKRVDAKAKLTLGNDMLRPLCLTCKIDVHPYLVR